MHGIRQAPRRRSRTATARPSARIGRAPEPSTLIVDWSELAPASSNRPRSRRWLSTTTGFVTSRLSRPWSSLAACPIGSRSSDRRAMAARRVDFRRTFARPRRTRRRAVGRLRSAGGSDRARRGCARDARCSSPSAVCPRDSACPTPACSSGPRPTCSTRSAGRTSGAARRRADVPLRFPRSEGRRPRRPRRPRHRRVRRAQADRGRRSSSQEFMELRYAGEDKLFVPVERLDLVQKYTGASRPALDRLGGTTWEKAKTRVKKAMRDMAEELLKLYASRSAVPGPRVQRRQPLAAGVRGRVRVGPDDRSAERRSPTSSATWNRRRRWTGCCAATSATARPKWRCARRSRR